MRKSGKNLLNLTSAGNVVIIVAFLCLCVCGYLWQMHQVATLGSQIKAAENSLKDLKRQNERHQIRLAELNSIPYLDRKVKELGLKLVQPEEQQIVRIAEPVSEVQPEAGEAQFARRHGIWRDR